MTDEKCDNEIIETGCEKKPLKLSMPNIDESKDDFIARCMSETANEYPDEKQRAAVCYSYWDKSEMQDKVQFESDLKEINPTAEWQKIKIFPKGKIFIQKYNDYYNFDDKFFNEIIANFNNINVPKPRMDKSHKYEENYAEFRNPSNEPDGLYMEIRLNTAGVNLVKNGIYNAISPAFGGYTDVKGNKYKNVLYSVSLTNFPALGTSIPDLKEQITLEDKKQEVKKMDEVLKELNLVAGAKELEAVEKIKQLKTELDDSKSKVVELSEKLLAIETEALKKEAELSIDAAIEQAKIHPATKDFWVNEFVSDKSKVLEYLSKVPEKKSEMKTANGTITQTGFELSAEDKRLMKLAELDEKKSSDVEIYLETKQNRGK